jgi:hypothetical protein
MRISVATSHVPTFSAQAVISLGGPMGGIPPGTAGGVVSSARATAAPEVTRAARTAVNTNHFLIAFLRGWFENQGV